MGEYKVMTGTVSFGQRVTVTLGMIRASNDAVAERIMWRLYPAVTGWRSPWLEPVTPA